jgi:hypothetical protein
MKAGIAIYGMLANKQAIIDIVDTRIYPESAPEGAVNPYIVYSIVGNSPVETKEETVIDEAQIEIFCVTRTYSSAMDLADTVRGVLDRRDYTNTDAGKEIDVQSVLYTNEVTEVNQDRNTYVAIQDYTMRIKK